MTHGRLIARDWTRGAQEIRLLDAEAVCRGRGARVAEPIAARPPGFDVGAVIGAARGNA